MPLGDNAIQRSPQLGPLEIPFYEIQARNVGVQILSRTVVSRLCLFHIPQADESGVSCSEPLQTIQRYFDLFYA
jgi:hypothetical protein